MQGPRIKQPRDSKEPAVDAKTTQAVSLTAKTTRISRDRLAELAAQCDLFTPIRQIPEPELSALLTPDEPLAKRLRDDSLHTLSVWAPLVRALRDNTVGEAAPPAFVAAIVTQSRDAQGWVNRLGRAAGSVMNRERSAEWPSVAHIKELFARWLFAGIRRDIDAASEVAVAAFVAELVHWPGPRVLEDGRALLAQLALHPVQPELVFQATITHASRCIEDGEWFEALSVSRAAQVGAQHGDARAGSIANRLCAAAHLGQLEIHEARFALKAAKSLEAASSRWGPILGRRRIYANLQALEEAKRHIAFHAQASRLGGLQWAAAVRKLEQALHDARLVDAARLASTELGSL